MHYDDIKVGGCVYIAEVSEQKDRFWVVKLQVLNKTLANKAGCPGYFVHTQGRREQIQEQLHASK